MSPTLFTSLPKSPQETAPTARQFQDLQRCVIASRDYFNVRAHKIAPNCRTKELQKHDEFLVFLMPTLTSDFPRKAEIS